MTLAITGGQASLVFLVMIRCLGIITTAPIYSHHAIPRLVKFGLAAALAIALVKPAGETAGTMTLIMAAPIELIIGLSIGFILSMGFQAVELAGRVISLQLGLSIGSVFSPTQEEGATAIDPFFSILAGLLFLAMGLHLAVVQTIAHSFVAYPVGGGWPLDLPATGAQTIELALELGARVALPIALVLLLVELAVALLARAIPQINVFIFGLPLKMTAGIAILSMAMPTLMNGVSSIFRFVFNAASGGTVGT